MIKLYYSFFYERLSDKHFSEYLQLMPENIKVQIDKYHRWEDQHSSLLGKLLLKQGIEDLNLIADLNDLKYTNLNKPYLPSSQLNFSISHSNNLVACAFSTESIIGLDLEEIKNVDIDCFHSKFTTEEWNIIRKSKNKFLDFYTLWTIKEAVVKAEGKGLKVPFKNIRINKGVAKLDNTIWYIKKIILNKKYVCHFVSNKPICQKIYLLQLKF